jgi:Fe2+ transport system protein FeoA
MHSSLSDAPCATALTVVRIADADMRSRLARMGVFPGSQVTRLDEEVATDTVRLRGPRGEVVLGGGMGGKIVAHLDDGRMIPLAEMNPGERGHIEAITGGTALTEALAALGLCNDDEIEMIRRLPPMQYITLVDGRTRIRLAEGMAAKILGRMGTIECQFANAQAGTEFNVTRIIGGERAARAIDSLGIRVGGELRLESVEKAPSYRMAMGNRFIIASSEGLRLYLRSDQADVIIVKYVAEER